VPTPVDPTAQPQPAAKVVAPPPVVPVAQPVRLSQLVDATQAAIRVTARDGGASATIVLHPQELGTVEIQLHYGADGVSATVHADSPQAVQTLQQASPDLKRSLEAQGMVLLGLDVRDRTAAGDGGGRQGSDRRRRGGSGGFAGGDERDDSVALDPRRLPLAGAQIDVLA
jgi:flagellar hook-length control protein FliK